MGVAYFLVFDKPASFDTYVSGKAIAQDEELLSALATKLKVKPLAAFVSMSADEFADLAEDFDVSEGTAAPAEEWFAPETVLKTVRALAASIKKSPAGVANAKALLFDLSQYEEVLVKAGREKLQCHLSVDI